MQTTNNGKYVTARAPGACGRCIQVIEQWILPLRDKTQVTLSVGGQLDAGMSFRSNFNRHNFHEAGQDELKKKWAIDARGARAMKTRR